MIPVVDLSSRTAAGQLIDAWQQFGFASVVGHGIDVELCHTVREQVRHLFDLDDVTKRRYRITPTNYRGYIPLGFFTPNRAEVTGTNPDHYEGWKLHWECPPGHPAARECPLYGPNRWPEELPGLAATVDRYWAACDALSTVLLDAIADELSVERAVMHRWHQAPLTNMTLLHYPASSPADPAGIHPHRDTNVITLLHPDPVGGLEVRTLDGRWLEVEAPPDALVVNTGEMLELWSGGRLPATPHRVVNRSGAERYSFPYFVVPNHAVTVAPLVDPPPGFDTAPMPVGELSAEVWRTNWPGELPTGPGYDLGSLDR